NRASPTAPTLGMINQIRASLGQITVPWNNYSGQQAEGFDKTKAIKNFQDFLSTSATNPVQTNLVMQAPFTAVGSLTLLSRWSANDPLVHYTVPDLIDLRIPSPMSVPTNTVLTNY